MIDYIKGELAELTPTYAVIEAAGVGYEINIALTTFTTLSGSQPTKESPTKLFVTEIIREDAHLLFGFMNKAERELFLLLITVSGIGANTARMIMSAYSVGEIRQVIAVGNAAALSSIKGIGPKTAQRIIVELKDKVLKISPLQLPPQGESAELGESGIVAPNSAVKDEATAALAMLGFPAAASGKVVDKILSSEPTLTVERVIKLALKML